jgi:hypothetical protein
VGPSGLDRDTQVTALQREIGELNRRLDDIQALVHRTQLELCRRISTNGAASLTPQAQETVAKMRSDEYVQLVSRVHAAIHSWVPAGSVVAVVTRGDDALLELEDRTGWHFPRLDDGRFAGHYPASDDDAIDQLERVRWAGASYLVLPATARWWLDYYQGLRRHLEANARLVARHDDTCSIFAFAGAPSGAPARPRSAVN